MEKLSQAVNAGSGPGQDTELRQQLSQLNIPTSSPSLPRTTGQTQTQTQQQKQKRKSNLCAPYPPNLPLALLRLMEAYVIGLAEQGSWQEAKRERGLNLIKTLTQHLGDAERLSSSTLLLLSLL